MHDLAPLTALGGAEPRTDRAGALTLTEVPDVTVAGLAARRGRGDDARAAVERLTGAPAPGPGHWAGGPVRAIWSAPDRWLIEAPESRHPALAAVAKDAAGDAAAVTEETDAHARFDLAGPADAVVAAMERLCALDVETMAPGTAARTRLHHVAAILLRTDDGMTVLAPRAYAGSAHHDLLGAMRSLP